MNARNENKYSMYLAVKKLLITNNAIWAAILGFAAVVALFFAKLLLLQATDNKRTKKTKGITTDKKNKKIDLMDAVLAVAGAVQSHANDIKDHDLFESVNFRISDLENMGDTELEDKATLVFDVATAHAADIAPKGITAVDMVNFNTLIVEYGNLVQAPRNAISNKKTAGAMLKTLFTDIDDLLINNLDRLMIQFKKTQPEFYKDYFNNRKILDLGKHHTRLGGTITDGYGNPIYGAIVKAVEADLVTETDIEGNYLFKPFTAGIYTVTAEKEGFDKITQDLVEVGVGQNVVLDLQMAHKVYAGPANSLEIVNVLNATNPEWRPGVTVKIKNTSLATSGTSLNIYPATTSGEGYTGHGSVLAPGQEEIHTLTAADFKPCLNVQNPGANPGSYEITIL